MFPSFAYTMGDDGVVYISSCWEEKEVDGRRVERPSTVVFRLRRDGKPFDKVKLPKGIGIARVAANARSEITFAGIAKEGCDGWVAGRPIVGRIASWGKLFWVMSPMEALSPSTSYVSDVRLDNVGNAVVRFGLEVGRNWGQRTAVLDSAGRELQGRRYFYYDGGGVQLVRHPDGRHWTMVAANGEQRVLKPPGSRCILIDDRLHLISDALGADKQPELIIEPVTGPRARQRYLLPLPDNVKCAGGYFFRIDANLRTDDIAFEYWRFHLSSETP